LVAAAIVEEYERRDPVARLHVRVMGGHGALFVAGEVASSADFDVSSVVKRVLGSCGVREEVEPFVALESMSPSWACETGSHDGATVIGYATRETPERVLSEVVLARRVARALETKRVGDEDWFWLNSDYEVVVERLEDKQVILVRAGHAAEKPLSEVRTMIHKLLSDAGIPGPIRINPAGEETGVGLAHRTGSSGLMSQPSSAGSLLASTMSGVGLHSLHPLNVGAHLARHAASTCVERELGMAILLSVSWLPMEARPHHIRIRNERGEDLGQAIKPDTFDLRHVPETLRAPGHLTQQLQVGYLDLALPWEKT
jgi:S-adenosylmethionine synthetase